MYNALSAKSAFLPYHNGHCKFYSYEQSCSEEGGGQLVV